MMFSTNVTLDGVTNGIAAYIRSRKMWLKRSDGLNNLFSNFTTLEARLFRESELDYHDVQFFFIVKDGVHSELQQISLNEAIKTDDGWKVARNEVIFGVEYLHIYNITEVTKYLVTNIGYITTNEANTHDPNKDPKFEYKKLKNLRSIIAEGLDALSTFQCYGISLSKSNYGTDIKIDNTTAHIHFWTNGRLMDYNTIIKKMRNNNEAIYRCLPFLPGQDKYGSIYMFVTTELSDVQCTYTRTRADSVSESLITYLQDLYPDKDIKYIPCQFNGRIDLADKEVNMYGRNPENGT